MAEGYRTLREVGALDKDRELTEIGMELGRLPVDPRMGRMLIEARVEMCGGGVTVIVAGLETSDPRERPAEKKREADAAHCGGRTGTVISWRCSIMWSELSEYYDGRRWKWNQLRKFCGKYFLNAKRVTEWGNVVRSCASFQTSNPRLRGRAGARARRMWRMRIWGGASVIAGGGAEAVRAVGQGEQGLPECGGWIFCGVPGVVSVRAEEAG